MNMFILLKPNLDERADNISAVHRFMADVLTKGKPLRQHMSMTISLYGSQYDVYYATAAMPGDCDPGHCCTHFVLVLHCS